jgi:excisionase family DNA binding protein
VVAGTIPASSKGLNMTQTPYRISELPVGRTKAYQEINEGRLRAVKCGKLTLILPEDYDQWLKSLPPATVKNSKQSLNEGGSND